MRLFALAFLSLVSYSVWASPQAVNNKVIKHDLWVYQGPLASSIEIWKWPLSSPELPRSPMRQPHQGEWPMDSYWTQAISIAKSSSPPNPKKSGFWASLDAPKSLLLIGLGLLLMPCARRTKKQKRR